MIGKALESVLKKSNLSKGVSRYADKKKVKIVADFFTIF